MTISGKTKRVAFYCRMNHRDRDYTQFMDAVLSTLEKRYGKQEWDIKIFFEVASGNDPDRKKFALLKSEIKSGNIDVVVSVASSMIARDWKQFMEFMEICEKAHVDVICTKDVEDAQPMYQRIRQFTEEYFGEMVQR